MKHTRIVVTRYGGPDAVQVVEEQCPQPCHGEVRVRVLAAGVSLPDVMMREGIHPEKAVPPSTPGWDLVGVVGRLGTGGRGALQHPAAEAQAPRPAGAAAWPLNPCPGRPEPRIAAGAAGVGPVAAAAWRAPQPVAFSASFPPHTRAGAG